MACKPTLLTIIINIITTLSFFLLINPTSSTSDCTDRWIYLRNLPSRFNIDLLTNCSDYQPFVDTFCQFLTNHGIGPKTHNNSQSWYRTDPNTLELMFHRRMLEYPCLTPDPDIANAVYLPYYSGLDALGYLYGLKANSGFEFGLDLFQFLQENEARIWDRNMGHDHFLVMSRPAWDFSQPVDNDPPTWGTSFLELPEFYNLTVLVPEGRFWPWQEQAIPYPTSFHPPSLGFFDSWIFRVKRSRRSALMLFAGGGGVASTSNIRKSIRDECENTNISNAISALYDKVCEIVECSNGICEHDPIKYMKPMLKASFCLQPPGDTPTRKSIFDAILAGCIPVFFEDRSAKSQYGWHLPEDEYGEFSVFIQKEEVVFKRLHIVDVLMGIPRSKVRRMRERVIELIPRVMFRRHASSMGLRARKDAFDIAIDGTLQRIKSRIYQHPDQ
ncbi:hypothetical protein ACFE04_013647 [Oxalis oulophora]